MIANQPRQLGFTLIELIVVLLIMSTMMAVSAPRVAGRTEAAVLRAGAVEIQALASAARAKAVLQQRPIALMIDSQGTTLRLIAVLSNSNDHSTLEDVSRRRSLPDGLIASFEPTITAETDLIRFEPDGTAQAGLLHITNTRDEQIILRLVQASGRLKLQDSS